MENKDNLENEITESELTEELTDENDDEVMDEEFSEDIEEDEDFSDEIEADEDMSVSEGSSYEWENVTLVNGKPASNPEADEKKKYVVKLVITVVIIVAIILALGFGISRSENKDSSFSDNGSSNTSASQSSVTEPTEVPTFDLNVNNVSEFISDIPEYKGIKVTTEKYEVSDTLVEYYAEYFYMSEAEAVEGRAAQSGDNTIIDYVGTIDGVAFDGGTATGQSLVLGSHSYIDGFEDGLIGAVAGETRELNLKFPENYGNEELNGKDCVFTVTVQSVIPGFTDEGVALLGDEEITTVEGYVASVKEYLEAYYEDEYVNNAVYEALEYLIDNSTFAELPEDLLAVERAEVNDSYGSYAAAYGYTLEDYLVANGTTLDAISESYAKQKILFYAIAAKENLYPTDEEAYEHYAAQLEGSGYESVEQYYADVTKETAIMNIMITKVTDMIFENLVFETSTEE